MHRSPNLSQWEELILKVMTEISLELGNVPWVPTIEEMTCQDIPPSVLRATIVRLARLGLVTVVSHEPGIDYCEFTAQGIRVAKELENRGGTL